MNYVILIIDSAYRIKEYIHYSFVKIKNIRNMNFTYSFHP